jgi:PPOX class probable F420-dependent enzyme
MPTRIETSSRFDRELKRLLRKYPAVRQVLNSLLSSLISNERPGDKIPGIGYDVYKTRLPNPSAQRGKSGGFRVIYYLRLRDYVILLTIYSKTEQEDISAGEIKTTIEEAIAESAVQEATMPDLTQYRTMLLETFKRDGSAVNTPVWFVQEGEVIYFSTSPDAWKTKRLRANPQARIAGADAAEKAATDWYAMTASFLEGDEAARIYDALDERYGGYFRRFDRDNAMTRVVIALRAIV